MNCNCGGQYQYCNCGEQYQTEYRQSGGFGGLQRPCPPGWIDRGNYCCRMTCIPKRPRPTWGPGMGGMTPGMGGMTPGMGGMTPGMGGMTPGMGGPRPGEDIYNEDYYNEDYYNEDYYY
jgi:hypothetical protein